jgi:hypothetical protein
LTRRRSSHGVESPPIDRDVFSNGLSSTNPVAIFDVDRVLFAAGPVWDSGTYALLSSRWSDVLL